MPHNVPLCTKYNAHINVEICIVAQAVKYLYKYVFKGHDKALTSMRQRFNQTQQQHPPQVREPVNDIQLYRDARYVSASEALWRLFSFSLFHRSPAVCWAVHKYRHYLAGRHFILRTDNAAVSFVINNTKPSKLQRWAAFLQDFDFEVHHMPGRTNPVSALSRLVTPDTPSMYHITIDAPDEVLRHVLLDDEPDSDLIKEVIPARNRCALRDLEMYI